mmetsp:Transcript_5213/g.14030  ORF Transcript_5213/g.14030 Transcript_5213/m.14030 type:complete len:213 (+) Transcript_5213:77-715(+)
MAYNCLEIVVVIIPISVITIVSPSVIIIIANFGIIAVIKIIIKVVIIVQIIIIQSHATPRDEGPDLLAKLRPSSSRWLELVDLADQLQHRSVRHLAFPRALVPIHPRLVFADQEGTCCELHLAISQFGDVKAVRLDQGLCVVLDGFDLDDAMFGLEFDGCYGCDGTAIVVVLAVASWATALRLRRQSDLLIQTPQSIHFGGIHMLGTQHAVG